MSFAGADEVLKGMSKEEKLKFLMLISLKHGDIKTYQAALAKLRGLRANNG